MNTSERPLGTGRPDVFRRRRRSERVPVDLQARIADSPVIVDVHDLTPEGVAFDSPVPIALGKRVVLLTHLDGVGGIGGGRDIALPVIARWTRHGHRMHHIGAEFAGVDDATRALLAEYCARFAPSGRHAAV